jgi:protein TonB
MSTRTAERRPLGALGRMGVVAALHVGLLYMIANSLGMVPAILDTKTEATIIDEAPVPDDPVPQPEPDLAPRRDTVVLPDEPPELVYEQETVLNELPPENLERREPPGGTAVVQPVIVGPHPDSRYPLSQPPYPPADVRAGNTGTAQIEVYVLPNGRVGEARIVKSTGYESLDRSALEEARRKWRLAPATRDGEPFAQWHRLLVTFRLNEQR